MLNFCLYTILVLLCLAPFLHAAVESSDFDEVEFSAAGTVRQAINSGSCSTTLVAGLSRQLMRYMNCAAPGRFASINGIPGVGITGGASVLPFLQKNAASALRRASTRGLRVTVTSAIRTLPQQLFLYRKFLAKKCGITAAAQPHLSNHLSGGAVDVVQGQAVSGKMSGSSFRWFGPADRVHYDYTKQSNYKVSNVKAFQVVYNRCAGTKSKLPTDGVWSTRVEQAMMNSPAAGWSKCNPCQSGTPSRGSSAKPAWDGADPGPDNLIFPALTPDPPQAPLAAATEAKADEGGM